MRRLQIKLLRENWSPVHACAYGVGVGFVLFIAQLIQPDAGTLRWPDPDLSARALMLLLLCAFMFAILAVARNRLINQR
jgi:hypothetical protein